MKSGRQIAGLLVAASLSFSMAPAQAQNPRQDIIHIEDLLGTCGRPQAKNPTKRQSDLNWCSAYVFGVADGSRVGMPGQCRGGPIIAFRNFVKQEGGKAAVTKRYKTASRLVIAMLLEARRSDKICQDNR